MSLSDEIKAVHLSNGIAEYKAKQRVVAEHVEGLTLFSAWAQQSFLAKCQELGWQVPVLWDDRGQRLHRRKLVAEELRSSGSTCQFDLAYPKGINPSDPLFYADVQVLFPVVYLVEGYVMQIDHTGVSLLCMAPGEIQRVPSRHSLGEIEALTTQKVVDHVTKPGTKELFSAEQIGYRMTQPRALKPKWMQRFGF